MQREEIKGLSFKFFYLVCSAAPVDSSQMKKNIWRKQKGVEQKAGRKLNDVVFLCSDASAHLEESQLSQCVRVSLVVD